MHPLLFEQMPAGVGWMFGGVALVGALTDYFYGKIYNWLTFSALFLGLALALYSGMSVFWNALGAISLSCILFSLLFFMGIIGGGDVKLVMALSTVLGLQGSFELMVDSLLIAGLGALALLIKHRRTKIFLLEIWKFLRALFTPGLEIVWPQLSREIKAPFGLAILIGYVLVFVKRMT